MQTIFPREAIDKANAATVKFQLGQDASPEAIVAEYVAEIQPVLDTLGAKAKDYMREVRSAVNMKLHATAMAEDMLPDKLTNPMNRKAVVFLETLLKALKALSDDGSAMAA